MKKILMIISLLVVAMFLISGCAEKADEELKKELSQLSDNELDEVLEAEEGGEAIAGQAIRRSSTRTIRSTVTEIQKDRASLLLKTTTDTRTTDVVSTGCTDACPNTAHKDCYNADSSYVYVCKYKDNDGCLDYYIESCPEKMICNPGTTATGDAVCEYKQKCVDSDSSSGGAPGEPSSYVKGTTIGMWDGVYTTKEDSCSSTGKLSEYLCMEDGLSIGVMSNNCPEGEICDDGICRTEDACFNTDHKDCTTDPNFIMVCGHEDNDGYLDYYPEACPTGEVCNAGTTASGDAFCEGVVEDSACGTIVAKKDNVTLGGIEWQYKGADDVEETSPAIKFLNLQTGQTMEMSVSVVSPNLAQFDLKTGGNSYVFQNATNAKVDDWKAKYICD